MTPSTTAGSRGLVFARDGAAGPAAVAGPASRPRRGRGRRVIALVLAGVFLPTFSMQILDGVLASAIFIVAVMWTRGGLLRLQANAQRPTAAASRPAAATAVDLKRPAATLQRRPPAANRHAERAAQARRPRRAGAMRRTHLQMCRLQVQIINLQFSIFNSRCAAGCVHSRCPRAVPAPSCGLAAERRPRRAEHARAKSTCPSPTCTSCWNSSRSGCCLSREEYDELVKKAKKTPETHAPLPAVIVAADYAVTAAAAAGRNPRHAGHRRARRRPARPAAGYRRRRPAERHARRPRRRHRPRRRRPAGAVRRGHRAGTSWRWTMVAPLETTAARQVLNFRLPRPAAARLRLTVPGDVEIKGGADVVSRTVDAAAKRDAIRAAAPRRRHVAGDDAQQPPPAATAAVVARSVLVDEVAEAYEKLHATVSLEVLYRAVDQFRFVVPDGFEITEVTSPLLARWDVQTEGGRKVLSAKLREQTTEAVVLQRVGDPARPAGSKVGTRRGWNRWTWSAASPCSACWSRTGCRPNRWRPRG